VSALVLVLVVVVVVGLEVDVSVGPVVEIGVVSAASSNAVMFATFVILTLSSDFNF
jgi:hypothetical protein